MGKDPKDDEKGKDPKDDEKGEEAVKRSGQSAVVHAALERLHGKGGKN